VQCPVGRSARPTSKTQSVFALDVRVFSVLYIVGAPIFALAKLVVTATILETVFPDSRGDGGRVT
jgi:hypothetical protein